MTLLVADLLRRRVAQSGPMPLITYYDLATGERTELSAISFANWVAKTANLLVDELMLGAGSTVDLALAQEAPGHWVTFIWEMACWQVGAQVLVDRPGPSGDVWVIGPAAAREPDLDPAGAEVLACSLHPLGLGFSSGLAAGLADYALEVRGQPDQHAAVAVPATAPAWSDQGRTLSQQDLVGVEVDPGSERDPRSQRSMVTPSDPWTTVRDGLLRPLLSNGSAVVVLVAHDTTGDQLTRIAETERATRPSVKKGEGVG